MRWLALLMVVACQAEPLTLNAEEFVPVPYAEDPLAADRPRDAGCPVSTWAEEAGAIEVQTGACAYFTVSQPLPTSLRRGDTLTASVWHADLDAAEPAEGHVALWLGEEVLWEMVVQIPAMADVYEVSVQLTEAVPEGTPVGWHLHNHGYNSWKVAELTAWTGSP